MGGRYSRALRERVGSGESGAERAATREVVRAWLWVALWLLVVLRFSQGDVSAEWSFWSLEPLMRFLGLSPQQAALAHFFIRKTAHVVEYAGLGFLSFRAARLSLAGGPAAAAALLLCLAMAGLDEANQARLATRTGSPWDVSLDLAGGVLGVAVRQLVARWGSLSDPRGRIR